MMSYPRAGVRVVIHYRKSVAAWMPHHGKSGAVVIPGRGRPRNHGVKLDDGTLVVVPAGNIRPEPPCQ